MPAKIHPRQHRRLPRIIAGAALGAALIGAAPQIAPRVAKAIPAKIHASIRARAVKENELLFQIAEELGRERDRKLTKLQLQIDQSKTNEEAQKAKEEYKKTAGEFQSKINENQRKLQKNNRTAIRKLDTIEKMQDAINPKADAMLKGISRAEPLVTGTAGLLGGLLGLGLALRTTSKRERQRKFAKLSKKINLRRPIRKYLADRARKYKKGFSVSVGAEGVHQTQIENLVNEINNTFSKKKQRKLLLKLKRQMLKSTVLKNASEKFKYFLVKGNRIIFTDDPKNK